MFAATANMTAHSSAYQRKTCFENSDAPPSRSATSDSLAVISLSLESILVDARAIPKEVRAITRKVNAIIGQSYFPTITSRTATLTFARGTTAMAERKDTPGSTDASANTRQTRFTGKK